MIIALGVNKTPNCPKGPDRDNSKYTTSPTTTGGRPSSAFTMTIKALRPGKRYTDRAVPSGAPIAKAQTLAVRLTSSDRNTISRNCGSNAPIKSKAVVKALAKSPTAYTHNTLHAFGSLALG